MKNPPAFDLMRDLLDHEIVDADGISCGMVDDVQLMLRDDGIEIAAVLVGAAVSCERYPALLRVVARALGVRRRVRVPFEQIGALTEVVTLKSRAPELGLGVADRRVARWLARIPRT